MGNNHGHGGGRTGSDGDSEFDSTRSFRSDIEAEGTYDEVDGEPAYIIAELDRNGAWISIAQGGELEVSELR